MSSCISFHISNSSAALYSKVSRGSVWTSEGQGAGGTEDGFCCTAGKPWDTNGNELKHTHTRGAWDPLWRVRFHLHWYRPEMNQRQKSPAFLLVHNLPELLCTKDPLSCCLTYRWNQKYLKFKETCTWHSCYPNHSTFCRLQDLPHTGSYLSTNALISTYPHLLKNDLSHCWCGET